MLPFFKSILKNILRPFARPLLNRIRIIVREETEMVILRKTECAKSFSHSVEKKQQQQIFYQKSEIISAKNTKREKSEIINNILFVGDNTDTPNFGCRATGSALAEILRQFLPITDRICRSELTQLFKSTPLCDDLRLYLKAVKKHGHESYANLLSRIKKVDAVVLNGEGSFIFQSPPRKDLHYYFVILSACIEAGIPFYILNAMFTAFADEPLNTELVNQAMPILEQAEVFATRDFQSMQIIQQYSNERVNVTFIPDALFSWYSVFDEHKTIFNNMIANSRFILPFVDNNSFYSDLDFSHPYALFSGNSFASWHYDQALNSFVKLAAALKNQAEKLGIHLYLIETCNGDAVLRQVALITGIPFIPVITNIYFAGSILGNAQCYVSGRYHPSILASLSGTPCVFMGANSHKTLSLQTVLEIPQEEQVLFPAIPDDLAIPQIVSLFEKTVMNQDRGKVRKICEKNSVIVKDRITALFTKESLSLIKG